MGCMLAGAFVSDWNYNVIVVILGNKFLLSCINCSGY